MTISYSCGVRNIDYNRFKILKKYSDDYEFFIGNKKIDLENTYLDNDNIKSVRVDKKTKKIEITQFKNNKLFNLNNLNLDSLSTGPKNLNQRKINLIVIDGVPIFDSLIDKTKIDLNSIKTISVLTEAKTSIFRCNGYNGDVLLITTE